RETFRVLSAALDGLTGEIVAATPKQELGSASVRRGEALKELARRHLDRGAAATDHGNRPHLIVAIDWATPTGDRPEGRSEHLDGTFLGPEDARRLACDAQGVPAHHRTPLRDPRPGKNPKNSECRPMAGPTAPGPALPVPRLPTPHHLVRRPPPDLLVGTPRPHRPRQPHPVVPPSPHPHPPPRMETHRHRHPPHLHPTRRHDPPQRPTPTTAAAT